MKPKTEELLYLLLWSAERLMKPSFRNLDESFESWAYRNGLLTQISRLQKLNYLETDPVTPDARICRLSAQGRLHALGGRDPEIRWNREWDGWWRLALFDIAIVHNTDRVRFLRYLRSRDFGCLQGSVWITPDSLDQQRLMLRGESIDVEKLIWLEARAGAGESDAQIVAAAWDFKAINLSYQQFMDILKRRPKGSLVSTTSKQALLEWAKAERKQWLEAVRLDPLLPKVLLPLGYLGQKAWKQRVEVLAEARNQLGSYKPEQL